MGYNIIMPERRLYHPPEFSALQFWSIVGIVFIAALASYLQDVQHKNWEELCPGKMSVAPGETINFLSDSTSYGVYHHGISLGPDNVSISVVDAPSGKSIFGGTVRVDHGQVITIEGLNFQGRATKDQQMEYELMQLTEEPNDCVDVSLP